jgi:hypothetical protein
MKGKSVRLLDRNYIGTVRAETITELKQQSRVTNEQKSLTANKARTKAKCRGRDQEPSDIFKGKPYVQQ